MTLMEGIVFEEASHFTLYGFLLALIFLWVKSKLNNIWDYNQTLKLAIHDLKYSVEYFEVVKHQHEASLHNIKNKKLLMWMVIPEFQHTHFKRFMNKYSLYGILDYPQIYGLSDIMNFNGRDYALKVNSQTLNLYGLETHEEYVNRIAHTQFMSMLDTFDYSDVKKNIERYKQRIEVNIDYIKKCIPIISKEIKTTEKFLKDIYLKYK